MSQKNTGQKMIKRISTSGWRKVLASAAALVVFVTTYVLILPALTLESDAICGKLQHSHEESCYSIQTDLSCGLEAGAGAHVHTDDCYEETETLICTDTSEDHEHTESCYQKDRALVCTLEETEGHVHEAACYTETKALTCDKEEHTHTDACYPEKTAETEAAKAPVKKALGAARNSDLGATPYSSADPISVAGKGIISEVSGKPQTGEKVVYDPDKDSFHVEFGFNFTFNKNKVQNQDGYNYYVELGDNIVIPESMLNNEYSLKDSDGTIGGKYHFEKTANGKYRVVIKLSPDYVANAGDTMRGSIKFNGDLKREALSGDDSLKTLFTDNLEIHIPKDKVEVPENISKDYDITTQKEAGQYDATKNELTYTVYVKSNKGTPNSISFKDTISGSITNQIEGNPTVTVAAGENYSNWENFDNAQSVNVTPNFSGNTINMTLPKIEARPDGGSNTMYKITYTYKLKDGEYKVTATNKAEVDSQGDGQVVHHEDTKEKEISKEITISKDGQYDASTNRIKWTITVNQNSGNIAGAAILDDMFKDAQGDVTVEPNNGYHWVDGRIVFDQINGGANTNKYTIVYYTEAPAVGFNGENVSNTATYDGDGNPNTGNDQHGDGANVTVPGGEVDKSMDEAVKSADGKTVDIKWTVKVKIPAGGLKAGQELDDEIRLDWGEESAKHGMTSQQVMNWGAKVNWNGTELNPSNKLEVTFKGSDGNYYGFYDIYNGRQNGTLDESIRFTAFKIKLKEDLVSDSPTELTCTYHTTLNLDNLDDNIHYAKNKAIVGNKSVEREYVHRTAGVKKLGEGNQEGDTNVTNESGELNWTVRITPDEGNCKFTITDTLPAHIVLKSLTLDGNSYNIPEDGNINYDSYRFRYRGTYNKSTGVVTINMEVINSSLDYFSNGSTYHDIGYKCEVDKASIDGYTKGQAYTFKNSVVVKKNGNIDFGNDDQTQTWTEKENQVVTSELDKSGSWDKEEQQVHYSVVINQDGKDLVKDKDQITFEDVMSYQPDPWNKVYRYYFLDFASVRVYRYDANAEGNLGEELSHDLWSYTYKEQYFLNNDQQEMFDDTTTSAKNTITAQIPDSTPLVFVYSYNITMRNPETWGGAGIDISNTAKLYGDSEHSSEHKTTDRWEKWETQGNIVTEKSLILTKTEDGKDNIKLAGAVFQLYTVNADGSLVAVAGKTYTTNDKGVFVLSIDEDDTLSKNTVYALREIQAPNNYKLPPENERITIYFYESESDTSKPTNIPAGAVDLRLRNYPVKVTNEKLPGQNIEVSKKWVKADGTACTPPLSEIIFDVYEASAANAANLQTPENGVYTEAMMQQIGATVVDANVALNAGNSWKWSKTYDTYSTEYKYFVIEKTSGDFLTTVTGQGTSSIVITNKLKIFDTINISKKWFKQVNGGTPQALAKDGSISVNLYRVATPKGSGSGDTDPTDPDPGETDPTDPTQPEEPEHTVHTWDNGTVKTTATCKGEGVKVYHCTYDGCTATEERSYSDPNNHVDGTRVEGQKNQEGTENGYTGDTICNGCNQVLQKGQIIYPPSSVTYTVEIYDTQYDSPVKLDTKTLEAGQAVLIRFDSTATAEQVNVGWYSDYVYNGKKLTVNKIGQYIETIDQWNHVTWYQHQVQYIPSEPNTVLYLNSKYDTNISIEVINLTNSAAPLMQAPARAALRAAPSGSGIPANAEKLNDQPIVIYSGGQASAEWAWSGQYEVDPDYTYEYYVEEINSGNYSVVYKNQGTTNLVIENTVTEYTYELPHTGGMGKSRYTMGGLILMIGSAALMYIRHKKRREVS